MSLIATWAMAPCWILFSLNRNSHCAVRCSIKNPLSKHRAVSDCYPFQILLSTSCVSSLSPSILVSCVFVYLFVCSFSVYWKSCVRDYAENTKINRMILTALKEMASKGIHKCGLLYLILHNVRASSLFLSSPPLSPPLSLLLKARKPISQAGKIIFLMEARSFWVRGSPFSKIHKIYF